ncbi:MAG: hypothetical protein H6774_01710 [Pseudomonadales bacterium]|nr:hypothetical protein [Candidatus Woesebacteria bacterium]MCB9801784.1 hypothetical protein [Pseudomonadales bacterium]
MNAQIPEETSPIQEWSISDFYKKSWALTKQYKKLWIFGLGVIVLAGGGSYNVNIPSSSSSSSDNSEYQQDYSNSSSSSLYFDEDDSAITPQEERSTTEYSFTSESGDVVVQSTSSSSVTTRNLDSNEVVALIAYAEQQLGRPVTNVEIESLLKTSQARRDDASFAGTLEDDVMQEGFSDEIDGAALHGEYELLGDGDDWTPNFENFSMAQVFDEARKYIPLEFASYVDETEHVWNEYGTNIAFLLALSFCITLLVMIVIQWAIASWAIMALLTAIRRARTTGAVLLHDVAQSARGNIKQNVWLMFVPVLLLTILGVGLAVGIVVLGMMIPAFFLLFLPLVVFWIYYQIKISAAVIMGQRALVDNDLSGRESYDRGVELSSGYKRKMFRLGVANALLNIALLIPVVIVVAVAIALLTMIAQLSLTLSVVLGSILTVVGLALLGVAMVVLRVFNFGTWEYAYLATLCQKEGSDE